MVNNMVGWGFQLVMGVTWKTGWFIQGGAPVRERVQLVPIAPMSLGLMVGIPILHGVINQLTAGGAPPCRC